MDLVIINDSHPRKLAFYLAEEEYLARRYPDRDFFFAWQVNPSVIIGRNQLLEKEINVDYCHDNGVEIFRRKSGGGAVLADMNNIMFSYVTSSDDVCSTFSEYTSMVAAALRNLGLDASDNSRNDILIGDRKVSGNAYYHLPGRSIVHGTMLYDYDPVLMSNTLRPSKTKLASHGVQSTRSRVTTIKEHLPDLSISDFLDHILKTVASNGNTLVLTDDDIRAIEKIEQEYYVPTWLAGKNPRGTVEHSERMDGIGEIDVNMSVSKGLIDTIVLTGDFLENSDTEAAISKALVGIAYERESVRNALSGIELNALIPGMTTEKFISLIF
ncbi:MAG: lipoate--protein ligase [Duncaniella dubosii]|nr:lipoate--protein ligase [Duncaniella dubosii]